MIRSIIVVCTGNICRSPIGEALLRKELAGRDFVVSSAGIGAMVGYPADPPAQEVAVEHGLDLSGHRARQLSLTLLNENDLVLTLDQTHSDWINSRFPQFRGRTYKLLKWRGNRDVDDPYQRGRDAFVTARQDIELGVQDWLQKLK